MDERELQVRCDRPPEGWYCTRVKGHTGPCAAHPGEFNMVKPSITDGSYAVENYRGYGISCRRGAYCTTLSNSIEVVRYTREMLKCLIDDDIRGRKSVTLDHLDTPHVSWGEGPNGKPFLLIEVATMDADGECTRHLVPISLANAELLASKLDEHLLAFYKQLATQWMMAQYGEAGNG